MLVVVLIATYFSIASGWTNPPPVVSIHGTVLRKGVALQQSTVENENTEIPSSCPFSMRFPRYRIDLSGSSSISKNAKKFSSTEPGLFSTFKTTISKLALQQKYNTERYTIKYVDNLRSKLKEHKNDEKIKKGEIGIHISAVFWRELSDFSNNSSSSHDDQTIVLALPESSLLTLKRLVDVANWLETYISQNENIVEKIKSFIHADIDETMEIPTVILTKIYNEKYKEPATSGQTKYGLQIMGDFETIINQRTKAWVKRVLVNYGICPFTKSTTRSGQGLGDLGVPVGKIAYHASKAEQENILELMADTWEAISQMISAGPGGKDGVSSILLAAPRFDSSFPLWAGPIFAMLESNVSAANAEPLVGIVCFHPEYATPDGSSWPGFGHLHSLPRLRKWVDNSGKNVNSNINHDETDTHGQINNLSDTEVAAGGAWQRRTPHATINVLWAQQLEAAEGRRETGELYANNIRTLVCDVGLSKLAEDLENEKTFNGT